MTDKKNLYYFDFDANKWLSISSKVQLLSHEQKGIFIDLVAMCLIANGYIENNKLLSSKLKQTQANLSKCLECLKELEILEEKDGYLSIKFISEKFDRINRIKEQKRVAGRKGGQAKASRASTPYNNNNNKNNKKENLIKEKFESAIKENYSPADQKLLTEAAERISKKHPWLKEPPKTMCLIIAAIHGEVDKGRSLESAIQFVETQTEKYKQATDNWSGKDRDYITRSVNWFSKGGYLEDPKTWIKENCDDKFEVRDGWIWRGNQIAKDFTGAYDGLSFKNGKFTGHAKAVS